MSCGGGFCLGPSGYSPPGSAACCQADDGAPGSPMATERRMSNGSMGGSPQVLRGSVVYTLAAFRQHRVYTRCISVRYQLAYSYIHLVAPDAAGFRPFQPLCSSKATRLSLLWERIKQQWQRRYSRCHALACEVTSSCSRNVHMRLLFSFKHGSSSPHCSWTIQPGQGF